MAGLFFAHKASRHSRITVITKKEIFDSNSVKAQGGIAIAVDDRDSTDLHLRDTVSSGRGLSDREAVEVMVEEGRDRLKELISIGVEFDREESNGNLRATREGGHSAPRVLHYGDITGKEIMDKLLSSVRDNRSVDILEYHHALDLIVDAGGAVIGAFVLNIKTGQVMAVVARNTVLATGGAGKIYLYTSNPDVANGDGIALAYMAGARMANLEFVQFHPTCFYSPTAKTLLISEALRGEGAVLRNTEGEEFMEGQHPQRELAPRDIVARAIDREMKKSGEKHVYLDITHRSGQWLRKRFPYVYENCRKYGVKIEEDQIPVVPAAHYMVGGVKTDINGITDVQRLYAIGEVACSGVHGANRLASNSLLEAIVMASRCSEAIQSERMDEPEFDPGSYSWPRPGDPEKIETVILDHDWDLARRVMWDYVGIVRNNERLSIARRRIGQIRENVDRIYGRYGISVDMVELRNLTLVCSLVIHSAALRKESRGLHYNTDYPYKNPLWQRDTLLEPGVI
jgi:L-aspartate oxidase